MHTPTSLPTGVPSASPAPTTSSPTPNPTILGYVTVTASSVIIFQMSEPMEAYGDVYEELFKRTLVEASAHLTYDQVVAVNCSLQSAKSSAAPTRFGAHSV